MKLAFLAAAWLAGIFLGLHADAGPLPVLLFFLAALPAAGLLHLTRRSLWPAIFVGVFSLALLRVEAAPGPATPLVTAEKESVTLIGRVTNDPEAAARGTRFQLAVDSIERGSAMAHWRATALVYADPASARSSLPTVGDFRYGDRLRLKGELRRPRVDGDFDYPSYLASQGISGVFWARDAELLSRGSGPWQSLWKGKVFDLRRRLSASIENAITVPQSDLARGLLLGYRGQLSPELIEDFRRTGTLHILAISGLQVSVVLAVALAVATGLLGRRRHLYLLLPLALIWSYALVSGLPVSVVRAAIMGSVYLAALALGRPGSALPALAFSAAVMVGVTPRVIQQVSFQLSFASLGGIILAQPYQERISQDLAQRAASAGTWWRLWFWQGARWVLTALLISLGATLATWPLVAFNFNLIPLLGMFSTLLALPALPFILAGSLATAVTGLAHTLLGQFFGWVSWPALSYLLGLVSVFPGPTVSGSWVGAPLVWAWYLGLGALLLLPGGLARVKWMTVRQRLSAVRPLTGLASADAPGGLSLSLVAGGSALLVATVVLWLQVFSGPDGKLHVYFFDVGQGDSILIVTPGGRQLLVDGGPGPQSALRALAGPVSPGDRSLDLVLLTHLDADHSRGLLEVLDRYRLSAVLEGADRPDSPLTPAWRAALGRQQARLVRVESGYRVELEPGVDLQVLNPAAAPFQGTASEQNNNAVVLRLVHGQVSFLLASDIEAFAESYLVRRSPALPSTVLKVAHHGSRTSTTAPFLHRVRPTAAVISAGAGNPYGHPHPEVVGRLEQAVGRKGLFRTDRDGTIEFITNGHNLWVRTQRTAP